MCTGPATATLSQELFARATLGLLPRFYRLRSVDFLAALGVPVYPFGDLPVPVSILLANWTIRRYRLVTITPSSPPKKILDATDDAYLSSTALASFGSATKPRWRVLAKLLSTDDSKVTHHADELLFMVNSIMHATKIEAGIVEAEKRRFWPSGLLDDLQTLYDYPHGKDIELRWHYPPDLPPINSDQEKLKHVLQNLINNAIKFTDGGIVTVFAQARPERNAVNSASAIPASVSHLKS